MVCVLSMMVHCLQYLIELDGMVGERAEECCTSGGHCRTVARIIQHGVNYTSKQ